MVVAEPDIEVDRDVQAIPQIAAVDLADVQAKAQVLAVSRGPDDEAALTGLDVTC